MVNNQVSRGPQGEMVVSARKLRRKSAFLAFLLLFGLILNCDAYSVMSHEAIIDSAWDVAIKPLLLLRFPNTTRDELRTAHAYAYGGSVIQDMGYYPFGSKLFTNLLHYVRTADFVQALLRDSQNVDDYAFALGALAHYTSDNNGHKLAVNVSVPALYPRLREKYGDVVVYDEDPSAHLKTEFGFDVLQVARGRYAPDDYRDHIGFEVARPLLARAFEETYGLKLDSIFTSLDLAIGTYRRGVSSVIPQMTKVAWQVKKDEIKGEVPGITRKRFLYHLSRASYEKHWSNEYRQPGAGTRFLAFLFRLVPKVGPFRAFAFRTPTPETERFFMASFNAALRDYEQYVNEQKDTGHADLINDNLDTGGFTGPGVYPLADQTYAQLLHRLAENHFVQTTPELRAAILDFYKDPKAPFTTKKNKKEWIKVTEEVAELEALTPNAKAPAASSQ